MYNVAKTGSLGNVEKYSKSKLQKEVNKYKTRLEFSINNINMYNCAKNRKLLDDLFKNHYNSGFTEDKWIFEILQIEANKYDTRNEFFNINYNAYHAARYKNLISELFKNHKNNGYINLKNVNIPYTFWSKHKLQEECDKYLTRLELKKNNKAAYSAALRYKILDELFKNHKNNGYINKIKPKTFK
jgi:hypothetical protein